MTRFVSLLINALPSRESAMSCVKAVTHRTPEDILDINVGSSHKNTILIISVEEVNRDEPDSEWSDNNIPCSLDLLI